MSRPTPASIARGSGVFALVVGVLVLVGWASASEWLKGLGHGITMKPNTAVGLIACGLSLRLRGLSRAWTYVATGLALLAGTLGLTTLVEHLSGWNSGLDQLLFPEPPGALATASPGRMGPNAALSLTLASIALVLLNRRSERDTSRAQVAAFGMATLALVAIVGYLFGARELYSLARITGIAWPTAVTLLALAIGILLARSEAGPMAALVSDGPGGVTARRLLLPAIILPVAIGYLHIIGERQGLYDVGLGTAMLIVLLIMGFTVMIWRTAIRLDETSRAREAAQRERDELLVKERAAREQVERLARVKDEFLATMSHELRTPLNTLVGWTQMLQSDAVALERRAHAAAVIARNGRVLVRLVEDLLDLTRITTGRLRLERVPVDLSQVARAAVEAIGPDIRAKDLRIEIRTTGRPAWVDGDRDRLQQILDNLLMNAIKFTPGGGVIEVHVEARETTAQLTVSDSGKGIDQAFLPHVFERFRQQDGTPTREHGGLGIGLSIVRELVELHGGSVEVSSAGEGLGATFTVTFPLVSGIEGPAETDRLIEQAAGARTAAGILASGDR